MKEFTTTSPQETKIFAQKLAGDFHGGEILCLSGDLGAGKTTFTQGLLEALGAQGPYTSPTFTIVKEYTNPKSQIPNKSELQLTNYKLQKIYHIDAYRITSEDLRALGFFDFAGKPENITIIEWPENVKEIISESAMWLNFEWLDENRRKITFMQN